MHTPPHAAPRPSSDWARWLILALLLAVSVALAGLAGREGLLPAHSELATLMRRLALSAAWLIGTVLLIGALNTLLWDWLAPRQGAPRIPRLLRQLFAVVLFVLGFAAMLNQAWDVALATVLATTGVMGIVFGLALRNILADFFSGIALNMEQPFRLEDFVLLRMRGQRDPINGVVKEINWRSTRLLTPEDNLISVPNSVVAAATIENLSYPSPVSELETEVVLDWSVDPAFIEQVLAAAMMHTWARGFTSGDQPPKCRISRLDSDGVTYKILYLIDPRKKAKGPARHGLLSHVHQHLMFAGLRPSLALDASLPAGAARPVQRPMDPMRLQDRVDCLARVHLFEALTDDERRTLASELQVRREDAGLPVISQGDPGNTMYVIAAGVLEVRVAATRSEPALRVAVLGPGDFFGEMSLLTGAPRSATVATLCPSVLYEIPHAALAGLLRHRPLLADGLSQVVSVHLRDDAERAAAADAKPDLPARRATLAERIRQFFSA
jgi:small-conductance mechanosensitive channel/CRP-like cAMP-binding protein